MKMTPSKLIGVTCLAMLILMAAVCAFAVPPNPCDCTPRIARLTSDAEFNNLVPDIKFIAEGRFGDLGGAAEKEVKLEDGTGAVLQGKEANFAWPNCEWVDFELRYAPGAMALRFIVNGVTLEATSVTFTGLRDIFIRTRATYEGTKVEFRNLQLRTAQSCPFAPIESTGSVGPNDIDYLWIRCCEYNLGLTLKGQVRLCWEGTPSPLRSNLAFQIKVGSVRDCVSIFGGALRDLDCDCEIDSGDTPISATFKLYKKVTNPGLVYITSQTGTTFDFYGLEPGEKYCIEVIPPAGYTVGCAIAGEDGYVRSDNMICVEADECGCYDAGSFLLCPPSRQCFVPVTFTPHQWARFCCPFRGDMVDNVSTNQNNAICIGDPLIPEGLVYTRFPIAFECFRFFGEELSNRLVLGDGARVTFIGKTSCLENLCHLLGSDCYGCGPIRISVDCPDRATEEIGGCLLQETIALLMNIAYNDMRLMPKTPGVDLECYTLAEGPLKGKTVGQVLFIANEILGGKSPLQFGLIDCEQLVEIIHNINANYKFYDFNTTTDRGYLIPNRPFGQPLPPHCPEIKDYTAECVVGPCVRVTKTVHPLIARVGQTVTYKFRVCNCGPEDINVQSVVDTDFGDLTAQFLAANGGSALLEPTECVEFTVDLVIPLTDAQAIENTVTVTAIGGEDDLVVEDTDRAIVGILRDNPDRVCFLPTTLTAEGWARFCDPNNGVIQGGLIYNRFPLAFKCFEFYGQARPNELLVGNERIFIRYIGKTSCLDRLCLLLGGDCTGCGKLRYPLDCPWRLTSSEGGGCLAVETIVLLLNVAYNDMRLMPRTPGYNLECFTIASGPLKGKTVAEVFNIANELLQGKPPCMFGLVSCEQLVAILRQINANYEFVDFDTFNDRGFLIPNEPLTRSKPCEPTCPTVPMYCRKVAR